MDDISADQPELQAFALLAGVEPWKMAMAFNDPDHLFDHLTLEEIARFKVGCEAIEVLRVRMLAAMDQYLSYTRGVLAGSGKAAESPESDAN